MQLNQLERVRSQLAIGSFFGKVGLLNEAHCELEVLVGQQWKFRICWETI